MHEIKVLLVGINARTIQANPALYSLAETAKQKGLADLLEIKEYAIHTPTQHIMAEVFQAKPDIVAFSFYIWNALLISQIIKDIKKLLPKTKIILGGPEASARAQHYLDVLPIDAVCIGEGEESFSELLARSSAAFSSAQASADQDFDIALPLVKGFLLKNQEDRYQSAPLLDLAKLPFPYSQEVAARLRDNMKLVYYESSRGCPFHCSFCASAEEALREKPLDLVIADLHQLAKIGGQIKFIDRTFNAKQKRAIDISKEILKLYRPGLSWHFEVSPFALSEEIVALWMTAPKDYLHLEIGVQSLNPSALAAINRHGDWQKGLPLVVKLIQAKGCHVHLDLIAGLPGDNPQGFAASFHQLHQLDADYLQFGFLKVLPASPLAAAAQDFDLIYSEDPPYQVLSTAAMSPQYLFDLHQAERAFNALYNKTKLYRKTLIDLAEQSQDALSIYFKAAKLMPIRGLSPQEVERLVDQL